MKSFIILMSAIVAGFACNARAQIATNSSGRQEEKIHSVKIVLHPMPAPCPVLKYQLLPRYLDRKPGNAAVFYNKIPAERFGIFNDNEAWSKVCDLLEAPLAEFSKTENSELVNRYGGVANDTIAAAHYETCDWQLPLRESEFPYDLSLAEVQQSRSYCRALALKARQQIAEGKFEDAILTMQAGYAFARHVGAGPTLIHGLIGKAIAGLMSNQLQELLQQPDAPNLYWALSTLPRPLVDIRQGMEAEFDSFDLAFPELRDLDKKNYSPERWRELLAECEKKINQYCKLVGIPQPVMVVEIMAYYPQARRYLIERGMAADKVDAMPVAQTILLAVKQHYIEERDNAFKWCLSPMSLTPEGIKKVRESLASESGHPQGIFSIELFHMPALGTVMNAHLESERDIAALQILEVLRIHAASHDGRLPKTLADIAEVSVPQDPLNAMPFFYRCEGNKATLESPNLPGSPVENYYLKYEIEMQPNPK